ncbi:MAG: S8 family peptidase, partial [Candidatus Latescibacteria bacterium]|nr:S8 family peptidase [Candidatus Latescibacterota bacterium]
DEHPNDDAGHGTHVTGTIAQTTNNEVGVAGIAFNCSIMPVKVLNARGSGTAQALADGLCFAADNGADVINMSLGWPPGYDPGETVRSAIEYAYNAGVTLVASSGNEGNEEEVSYPAAYDEYVIAVGATRYDEAVAYYSQTGASLDLTAPGGDLNVDQNEDGYGDGVLQQTFGNRPSEFGYWFYTGTSMASPHVAGVAALVIANGVTGPDNVRSVLQTTAEDHGDDGWDSEYGWGIVDAAAALGGALPPILEITTTSLPDGVVGEAYSTTLEAARGTTPYTWSISAGSLPDGLSLSSTGVISGTPTTAGTVINFTAKVMDSSSPAQEATKELSIAVTEAPTYPTMHVASIAMETVPRTAGRNTFWKAVASVAIVDAGDNPVEGATVSGHWSDLTSDTDVFVTVGDGTGSCESDEVKNANGTFTFTVNNVVLSGWTYDEGASVTRASITVSAGAVASASVGSALSNSPNPANPSTEISYSIGQPGQVTLKVYNTLGQAVRTLVDEVKVGGNYVVRWDGKDNRGSEVSSGIYLYRIAAGEYSQTERIILLR